MKAISVMQDWVFHPYTTNTQRHTLQNDRQEESTQNIPIQQSPKTDSRHIMSDCKLDCAIKSDTPWNMIMKSGQIPTEG